ncbi:IclR family transcriptional regulator [Halalkalibacter krulwichiae]|uniref:Acetate operon repressor n=1 Tax=Halalkalibacter krulwichiae TaxID=199441 RepID=A0A1X9MF37_9BACI|nr:IclR family transcriptional regulator [Halalkalibacter krulwichiae]ARK29062.1 Acetate operon repressor [Halalkalibacter krulwichiae]
MEIAKKGTTIQSLQIGIGIVDLIAKEGRPLKFTEICELTKITKSNLYKYLNTLTQTGILYRDKETGSYVLGSKLIEYGMAATAEENVIDRITPYMQEINAKCLSTVLYSIWTNSGPMIVKEVNLKQGYNIGAQVGTLLPVLSANGKVFASFLEDKVVDEWIEKELVHLSEEQMQNFKKECQTIKQREIAFAREPLVSNVSSVAFPVFNYKKQLLGTVTVVGFSDMIPNGEEDELSQYLIRLSKEISATFGYKS